MYFTPTHALVTGASSGIGAAFARSLAGRGADLVLVARRADRLTALASELQAKFATDVTVIALDLSVVGAVETLKERLTALRPIDTIINCAGFGTHGPFVAEDEGRVREEIQLNIGVVIDITRAFLAPMLSSGRGAVVNIASLFAYQPSPNMAVYGATKSFILHFTEALWYETRKSGVKVLAVSPGPTRTEFFNALQGLDDVPARVFQSPEMVVAATLRALDRRHSPPSIASGALSNALARTTRLVSRRTAIRIAALFT